MMLSLFFLQLNRRLEFYEAFAAKIGRPYSELDYPRLVCDLKSDDSIIISFVDSDSVVEIVRFGVFGDVESSTHLS